MNTAIGLGWALAANDAGLDRSDSAFESVRNASGGCERPCPSDSEPTEEIISPARDES